MTQGLIVYGIPNCDTVKAARLWLREQSIPHTFHDLKKLGVPQQGLDLWLQQVGWERLLNRQGTTWRSLDEVVRTQVMDAESARTLLLAQPSLIKRPVVHWLDGHISVGFRAADWQAKLARSAP